MLLHFFLLTWLGITGGSMVCSPTETSLTSTTDKRTIQFYTPLFNTLQRTNFTGDGLTIRFQNIQEADTWGNVYWEFPLEDGHLVNKSRKCLPVFENGTQTGEQVSFSAFIPRSVSNQLEWIRMEWNYTLYYGAFTLPLWENQVISFDPQNVVNQISISNFHPLTPNGRLQLNVIATSSIGILDLNTFMNPNGNARGIRVGYTNVYLPDYSQVCIDETRLKECHISVVNAGFEAISSSPPTVRLWIVPSTTLQAKGNYFSMNWAIRFWDPPKTDNQNKWKGIALAIGLTVGVLVILAGIFTLFYRHHKLTEEQRKKDEEREKWIERQSQIETQKVQEANIEKERLEEEIAFNNIKSRLIT